MKKVTTILGIAILGSVLMSFQAAPECEIECKDLKIDDITYIEMEEEIDLGFDTAQYLPKNFDPYLGMGFDLSTITVIEEEEEINLGFDTAPYLPIGFNAYEGMIFEIADIDFIEEEEEIILDFEVQDYLPENFNANSK